MNIPNSVRIGGVEYAIMREGNLNDGASMLYGRVDWEPSEIKLKFRLAVQRKFKNANGEREADFLPIVCWRQTAEFAQRYLAKGRKVAVEGSIQTRSYDAQDGSKRYVTEVIADSVEAVGNREDGARKLESTQQNGGFTEVNDDDLPF